MAIAATAVFRKLQKFFLTPPTPTNKPTFPFTNNRQWCMMRQASRRLARLKTYLSQTQNKDKKELVAIKNEL
jgi:hypothetical protein